MTDLESQLRHDKAQVKSPVEMAEDFERMKKIFGGSESSAMMFMLQQMMSQANQPQLLAELAGLKAQLEAATKPPPFAPMPPLPPMPPAIDPMIGMVKLLEATKPPPSPPPQDPLVLVQTVMTMLAPLIAKPAGPDPVVEILRDQVNGLREELRDARNSPTRTIKDTLEEINLLEQFTGRKGGSTPDSFWEFLGRFFDNFATNTDALSEMIARVKKEERKQLPEGSKDKAEGPADDEREVPEAFRVKLAELDEAKTNDQRIEILMKALYQLGQDKEWRKDVQDLLGLAKTGKKDAVLKMLTGFLGDCAKGEIIEQRSADDTVKAFDSHFEAIVSFLHKMGEKPKEKGEKPKEKESKEPEAPAEPAAG